jgi:hypothetical protein
MHGMLITFWQWLMVEVRFLVSFGIIKISQQYLEESLHKRLSYEYANQLAHEVLVNYYHLDVALTTATELNMNTISYPAVR